MRSTSYAEVGRSWRQCEGWCCRCTNHAVADGSLSAWLLLFQWQRHTVTVVPVDNLVHYCLPFLPAVYSNVNKEFNVNSKRFHRKGEPSQQVVSTVYNTDLSIDPCITLDATTLHDNWLVPTRTCCNRWSKKLVISSRLLTVIFLLLIAFSTQLCGLVKCLLEIYCDDVIRVVLQVDSYGCIEMNHVSDSQSACSKSIVASCSSSLLCKYAVSCACTIFSISLPKHWQRLLGLYYVTAFLSPWPLNKGCTIACFHVLDFIIKWMLKYHI